MVRVQNNSRANAVICKLMAGYTVTNEKKDNIWSYSKCRKQNHGNQPYDLDKLLYASIYKFYII